MIKEIIEVWKPEAASAYQDASWIADQDRTVAQQGDFTYPCLNPIERQPPYAATPHAAKLFLFQPLGWAKPLGSGC